MIDRQKQDQQSKASTTGLTFVAVSNGVEVHVEVLVAEEEQTEPGVEGVDGSDEEDADDPSLLVRAGVVAQVKEDLRFGTREDRVELNFDIGDEIV